MSQYEYKVVPAPKKGLKAKGVKSSEDRFAKALEAAMNTLGADGWDYLRTDTLPCEERSGLTGRVTTFQNMLVFRRTVAVTAPQEDAAPEAAEPAPDRVAQTIAPAEAPELVLSTKALDVDPACPEPQVAAE